MGMVVSMISGQDISLPFSSLLHVKSSYGLDTCSRPAKKMRLCQKSLNTLYTRSSSCHTQKVNYFNTKLQYNINVIVGTK